MSKNMRDNLILTILLLTAFGALGFVGYAGTKTANEGNQKAVQYRQNSANNFLGNTRYLQDTRTNPPKCFFYYWDSYASSGPTVLETSCEGIPASLLLSMEKTIVNGK